MSPNTIAFRIPGPPRILVIDITNNRKGFEHKMSSDLMGKLKEAGVHLASEEVVLARTDDEYAAVFDRNLNFNILLLVAHGAPDLNEVKASAVAIPGGRSNWFQLASLSSSLSDKMVCLAVCHGFCRDAIDAFVRDGHFSLALVGSISSLSSIEVVTFFPRFFEELGKASLKSIDPNDVRDILGSENSLAHGKMKLFSEAVSQ